MRRSQVLLLLLIVIIPIGLLTAIGVRLVRSEQEMVRQRMIALLEDRLKDIDQAVIEHFAAIEQELKQLAQFEDGSTAGLRSLIRSQPRIRQMFVLSADGELLHPNPFEPFNDSEIDFLNQAGEVITSGEMQLAADPIQGNTGIGANASRFSPQSMESDIGLRQQPIAHKLDLGLVLEGDESGWISWFYGRGMNLVYWVKRSDGKTVGIALERARWIADLIAVLPDTPGLIVKLPSGSNTLFRIVDSRSQTVYQWGPYRPEENAAPACDIPLSSPLASWRIQQFLPPERLGSSSNAGSYLGLGTGLAVATLGILGLAWLFFREYLRDMREAQQRVSFVNQVSHELKTPLTNIRLYADLLSHDLESNGSDVSDSAKSRLSVVVNESERLSRMIGNVLTFARQQKESLKLHPKPHVVDDIIAEVLQRFQPSLDQCELKVVHNCGAGDCVLCDDDAVRHILGNLVSNIEKYAPCGTMTVTTMQSQNTTTLRVSDTGPGVSAQHAEKIFEPFWRPSDQLHHPAGTGIGLSIARELARLHGGDLRLVDAHGGATFEVTLNTPSTGAKA